MGQPPGDGGDGRRDRLGICEVDGPLAVVATAPTDAPTPRHRLPEVLLVGEPVELGPQLVFPVPGQLFEEERSPVDGHEASLRASRAGPLSRISSSTVWSTARRNSAITRVDPVLASSRVRAANTKLPILVRRPSSSRLNGLSSPTWWAQPSRASDTWSRARHSPAIVHGPRPAVSRRS